MKFIQFFLIGIMATALSLSSGFAQKKASKFEEISILTSSECGMCKSKIEKNMIYEKGVRSVALNLETKVVKIVYSPKKNTPESLKTAITKLGYDADEMQADPVAYEALPACCKKGGHSQH